jgi:hypothetical protein
MWWDDLNPANGGSVRFFTDNAATFEVCFAGVPEYFATGANSFRLTASSAGLLTIDYGAMSSVDGLVGLSPGNNLDPVGTAMNMSISPNSINPGAAVYELFTAALPNDLAGFLVQFLMDGAGNPITQL